MATAPTLSDRAIPRELGTLLFDVPLDSLTLQEGSSGEITEQGMAIVTSSRQWGYCLSSPDLQERNFAGEAVVRICGEFRSGTLGFGVLAREDAGEFIVELAVRAVARSSSSASDASSAAGRWSRALAGWRAPRAGDAVAVGSRTIDISLPDIADAGAIIIRNQSGDGPSEATIRSIQVFRPAPVSLANDAAAAWITTSFATQALARATNSTKGLQRFCIVCGQDVDSWVPFHVQPSEFIRRVAITGSSQARHGCPHCRATNRERSPKFPASILRP